MAKTIATIKGTMLAPGISKNNRKYTNEAIGRMVNRMKERLNDPNALPVVMRTHHDAGDNSRLIVGRITSVQQESDGRATYEAKLYNTVAGRDIAALIDGSDGAPALRTTSVFGRWVGPTMETKEGGKRVEVGEDLAIEALDFTASPGVEQSRIDTVAFESHSMTLAPIQDEVALDGVSICENYEATIELDEDVDAEGEDLHVYERDFTTKQRKSMAAKGQAMAGGRYPIANKSDLRNAIRAVGRGSGDHNAIRQHIMKRAAALGLSNMIPDNWKSSGAKESVAETQVEVCVLDDDGCPIVKICATNVEYDDIKKAAKAAAKIAVRVIDPDQSDAMDDDPDGDGIPDDLDPADNGDDYNVSVSSGKDQNDMSVPSGGDNTVRPAPGSYPSADRKYESEATDMSVLEVKVDGVNGLDNLIQALSAARQGMAAPTAPAVETQESKEESAVSETEKTAAAAAPGLSEADIAKLAAAVSAAVTEAMDKAADNYNAVAKGKAKSKGKKASDTSDNGPAESTSKAGSEVAVTETAKDATITEADRKKLIDELRESLVKEGAIPQRKGYRHVSESDTDVTPTGDELWDKRSDIWGQFFPWGQNQPVAPTDAAS